MATPRFRYVGPGFVAGIPMRDLDDADVTALEGPLRQELEASSIYEEVALIERPRTQKVPELSAPLASSPPAPVAPSSPAPGAPPPPAPVAPSSPASVAPIQPDKPPVADGVGRVGAE